MIISILRIMLSECNGFRSLLGSEVGVGVGMRDWPKQRLGVSWFVFGTMFSL